jgi:RNA polymerase sigma-70 factor (ECF subfamily)
MEPDVAFIELVTARSSVLLRTAYLLTGDRALAEDLLQESYFAAYRSRDRVRDLGSLEGYVRTTMVRTYVSWRRRRSSGELPMSELPDRVEAPMEPSAHDPLWRLLRALPAKQRAVVVLAYYEDLSEAQIAEAMGCSTGTVKSHRARALTSLRAALGPELAQTEELS